MIAPIVAVFTPSDAQAALAELAVHEAVPAQSAQVIEFPGGDE